MVFITELTARQLTSQKTPSPPSKHPSYLLTLDQDQVQVINSECFLKHQCSFLLFLLVFESLRLWAFESLHHWVIGSLSLWVIVSLSHCVFESLSYFGSMSLWVFASLPQVGKHCSETSLYVGAVTFPSLDPQEKQIPASGHRRKVSNIHSGIKCKRFITDCESVGEIAQCVC